MSDTTQIRIPKTLNERISATLSGAGDRRSIASFATDALTAVLDYIATGDRKTLNVIESVRTARNEMLSSSARVAEDSGLAERVAKLETALAKYERMRAEAEDERKKKAAHKKHAA